MPPRHWTKLKRYPGVYSDPADPQTYRVRAVTQDLLGRRRELDRIVRATSAREAEAIRQGMIRDLSGRAAGDLAPRRWRLAEYAERWILLGEPHVRWTVGTQRAQFLDAHVLPTLGQAYLDAIGRDDVQILVNGWMKARKANGAPYSVATIGQWFKVFRLLMRDAEDAGLIERDPCRRIKLPKREALVAEMEQHRTPTLDEMAQIREHYREHHPHLYALLMTMLITGMRFAHASMLRWEDIDEGNGWITPRRSRDKEEVPTTGPRNADESSPSRRRLRTVSAPLAPTKPVRARVPLTPVLRDILRAHRQWCVGAQPRGFSDGWTFPSAIVAGPIQHNAWTAAWRQTIRELKIPLSAGWGPHSMRRLCVDLMRAGGVPTQTQRLLTLHSSDALLDVYASVGLEEAASAQSVVERLAFGDLGVPGLPVQPTALASDVSPAPPTGDATPKR